MRYSVLVITHAVGNGRVRERFIRYAERGLDWLYRQILVEMLREAAEHNDLRLLLADPQPATRTFGFKDERTGMGIDVTLIGRVLGEDTGSDILLDTLHQFSAVLNSMREHTRQPTPEELQMAQEIAQEIARKR